MSHFLSFVTDGNGVVIDPLMANELKDAMSATFGFDHVSVYSHGWWTDATDASENYNRFSLGLVAKLRAAAASGTLSGIPAEFLAVGLHWPSKASDDRGPGGLPNLIQPLTFYAMEKRADDVGETGVYAMVRTIVNERGERPLTVNLLGHSFGCKVVCAALNQLAKTCGRPDKSLLDNVRFNVVLLQAAFDSDDFEKDKLYGSILPAIPNLRVLVTTSKRDDALGKAYPAAHGLEFFSGNVTTHALGFDGPTPDTCSAFGGCQGVTIAPGADMTQQPAFTSRLISADLTPLHDAQTGFNGGASGHHSDIYLPEIYSLVGRLLF
jgi:hypothetical protein